jgi:hypothetical protein
MEKWVKSTAYDHDEAKELRCPKCGCEKLIFDTEEETGFMDFGKKAVCWECRHEFTITENCWRLKR